MKPRALFDPPLPGLAFRPVGDDDLEFLYRVYASTRTEELAVTDWTDGQKHAFLRMQFQAQHDHYQTHYVGASFQVIVHLGDSIGRLYLHESADEMRIIDISLLPEHRRLGVGSAILRHVLAYAGEGDKSVRLHVETFNPALELYDRLGFRVVDTRGPYFFMEWSPKVPA